MGAGGKVVGLDVNPAALHVAESQPVAGAAVEWQQASADAIPFQAASFDASLCQQALQFFPDRTAALTEMHRVLVAGGRLVASTWRDVRNCPGYAALADAMAAHVGPEPATFIRATGALDGPELLESELAAAGFHEVVVVAIRRTIRFPSPEDFVWQFVQATPLALLPCVNEADTTTRGLVVDEVATRLRSYVQEDGLAFPIEAHVVTARK